MKQLLMIYEELKLKFPNHSSLIIFVKTIRELRRLKIVVSTRILNITFPRLVERDDYEIEDIDDIKNFLRSQLLKSTARKAL